MKRKATCKLQLLTDSGMNHFLDFIRNLAPQVFLFAVSWLIFERLNSAKIDSINFVMTVFAFVLLIFTIYAFIANYILFFKRYFSNLNEWHKKLNRSMVKKSPKLFGRFKFFTYAIFCKRLIEHIEFILTFAFVSLVIFTVVILMSMVTASTFKKAIDDLKISCPKGFICTPMI